jgi:hypothetical protein
MKHRSVMVAVHGRVLHLLADLFVAGASTWLTLPSRILPWTATDIPNTMAVLEHLEAHKGFALPTITPSSLSIVNTTPSFVSRARGPPSGIANGATLE